MINSTLFCVLPIFKMASKKIARALIGGNWKCNGTLDSIKSMADVLVKGGAFSANSEGR